ncbi:hypothetical protein L6452_22879 [Arctium lappa]|uniref:Uncharacterized protein n=1 Tax=Arctium lappa TaxID=4217 RepID=A0ACB9B1V3_ARCLA|nr:hypothetical protein L6452_22879 [Arctium lappa]
MASPSTKPESSSQKSFYSDNGSTVKPPKFNSNNFSLWKSRMMLFLEGADSRYLTILSEGPLIPKVWVRFVKTPKDKEKKKDDLFQVSDDSSEEERNSATGRYVLKTAKEFNDEDRRIIGLDSKVRTIIAQSLPDEVYQSLVSLKTAKEMWSTLCVLYEDEPTSDSEKEVSSKCLMAKLDEEPKDSCSRMDFTAECSSSSSQVHPFLSLTNEEKIEAFDSLTVLFHNEKDAKKRANAQVKSLSSQLQVSLSQLKQFDKLKTELDDLKTLNYVFAKEKNKLLKKLQKEQETVNKWNTSSKNLEKNFQDQVVGETYGLGYWKENVVCTPSENISSPTKNIPLSSKLPSYSSDWDDSNSEDSNSVYSMDLRDSRKFGYFVSAKSSKPLLTEDQDSNELVKPVNDLLMSLKLKEVSSSFSSSSHTSTKAPLLSKGKSVVVNIPNKRKITPSSKVIPFPPTFPNLLNLNLKER